jgi:hypothetical protein
MHKGKVRVEEAVEYLLKPDTRRRLSRFDSREWKRAAQIVSKRMKRLLGDIPEPDIVLYPGMRRSNGKLIHLGSRPVISLSPDFGFCSGDNLYTLIAHEYVHYLRAVLASVRFENMPIYRYLFEEGLAVYLSAQVLPDRPLSTVFMSRLHNEIGLNDPKGGYVRWCKEHLRTIASTALEALSSRSRDYSVRLFECERLRGKNSPVRTGYYLGFRMIEHAAERMGVESLLTHRPTPRTVKKWIESLPGS